MASPFSPNLFPVPGSLYLIPGAGTPAKKFSRRRVSAADQVDPKAVFGFRRELMRHDGHLLFAGRIAHFGMRRIDMGVSAIGAKKREL